MRLQLNAEGSAHLLEDNPELAHIDLTVRCVWSFEGLGLGLNNAST
jgi:hypothetical protein